jgi:hypothetical protein
VRDRFLPGRGDNGWSGPAETPVAQPPAETPVARPPVARPPVATPVAQPPADTATTLTAAESLASPIQPGPEFPDAAVVAGAPGTADAAVARAERAVAGTAPDGASLSHEDLPLADYDHLTLPALRARLSRLDLTSLVQLRDYEKAHANRLPVVTMLDNRIAKVTASNGN